ncbi:Protein of unknown function [Pyronema omphalodes CBS 100304]|uniref:Uncharacterized protein n=1 Tax=Pyronema omphalodes (strain CBS 100304) TaxID=1076935 RepID=U4KWI4_PYROM|nr:Protein of unknown function [Pyronema omphalodes CBS 100304]
MAIKLHRESHPKIQDFKTIIENYKKANPEIAFIRQRTRGLKYEDRVISAMYIILCEKYVPAEVRTEPILASLRFQHTLSSNCLWIQL